MVITKVRQLESLTLIFLIRKKNPEFGAEIHVMIDYTLKSIKSVVWDMRVAVYFF